ncbi:hypothetical protein [Rhizobium phaseoli]|uniref:hypothetical protein n=1 Tax=Rhizobium phaseoli TaxID=396 RepID=UPI000F861A42|nr:hypothetical protein [Rhizobium phaseoli]
MGVVEQVLVLPSVVKDDPDLRDQVYLPSLRSLPSELPIDATLVRALTSGDRLNWLPRDQGAEGTCAAQAAATLIDLHRMQTAKPCASSQCANGLPNGNPTKLRATDRESILLFGAGGPFEFRGDEFGVLRHPQCHKERLPSAVHKRDVGHAPYAQFLTQNVLYLHSNVLHIERISPVESTVEPEE